MPNTKENKYLYKSRKFIERFIAQIEKKSKENVSKHSSIDDTIFS
jgi:hypothetical protein